MKKWGNLIAQINLLVIGIMFFNFETDIKYNPWWLGSAAHLVGVGFAMAAVVWPSIPFKENVEENENP